MLGGMAVGSLFGSVLGNTFGNAFGMRRSGSAEVFCNVSVGMALCGQCRLGYFLWSVAEFGLCFRRGKVTLCIKGGVVTVRRNPMWEWKVEGCWWGEAKLSLCTQRSGVIVSESLFVWQYA